jgi:transposase-like protein
VLVAIGVDRAGRRQVLGVDLANRESRSSWRDFLAGLKARGLFGVEYVVSDNHAGLKAAIREVLPEAAWQRCYVGLLKKPDQAMPMIDLEPLRRTVLADGSRVHSSMISSTGAHREQRSAAIHAASRFRLIAAAVR